MKNMTFYFQNHRSTCSNTVNISSDNLSNPFRIAFVAEVFVATTAVDVPAMIVAKLAAKATPDVSVTEAVRIVSLPRPGPELRAEFKVRGKSNYTFSGGGGGVGVK